MERTTDTDSTQIKRFAHTTTSNIPSLNGSLLASAFTKRIALLFSSLNLFFVCCSASSQRSTPQSCILALVVSSSDKNNPSPQTSTKSLPCPLESILRICPLTLFCQ